MYAVFTTLSSERGFIALCGYFDSGKKEVKVACVSIYALEA